MCSGHINFYVLLFTGQHKKDQKSFSGLILWEEMNDLSTTSLPIYLFQGFIMPSVTPAFCLPHKIDRCCKVLSRFHLLSAFQMRRSFAEMSGIKAWKWNPRKQMGWRKPFPLDWINHKSAIRCSYITPKLGHALAAMYQTRPLHNCCILQLGEERMTCI